MRTGIPLLLLALAGLLLPGSVGAAPEEPALRRAIERFVRENAPVAPAAVEVPPLADFVLGGGADREAEEVRVELSVHPRERFVGRVPVTLALRAGDRELKRGVVTVGVRIERPVVVAARPVRRGQRLTAADLRVEARDLAELEARPGREWRTRVEEILGRRARRSLRAGEPVDARGLETAPVVERGQTVRLALERGALRIEAVGEARRDGRVGDWIEVLNRDSRRELVGRVGADGVVHVEF